MGTASRSRSCSTCGLPVQLQRRAQPQPVARRDPQKVFTPNELLAIPFAHRPYFAPGSAYRYSNTNTILLGLIVEQVEQRPLTASFRERLFTPLHMQDTLMPAITYDKIPRPHPQGYMYGSNVLAIKTAKLPPEQLAAAEAGRLKPRDVTNTNPSWAGAAGAAISTAEDLVRWVQALGDGALLDPTWQRRRLDSVRPTVPGHPGAAFYGLAIARFGPLYGHTGELPGFQTFTGYDPDKKVTLVVWANLTASP